MKELLSDVLIGWADLWRYPELLSLLVREPNVETAELARAMVSGMVSLRTPGEIFWALVDAGEFMAGRALLHQLDFRASLDGDNLIRLEAAIDLARVRAQQEVEARVAMLRERARAAGHSQDPPGGLEQALDVRRTQADLLVDSWEEQIEKAESVRGSELRERLRVLSAHFPSLGQELIAWQESVSRCIEARRLDAALFLLEGGPSKPPPDEPLAIPKQAEQFWNCSLREALGWINNTLRAPRDFKARPVDEEAKAIARVLTRLVDQAPGSRDNSRPVFSNVQEVEQFAETVDRFFGYCETRPREVLEVAGGYETRLYGLDDPRLPCFALYGEAGLRLWLPGKNAEDGSRPVSSDHVLLGFSLTPTVTTEHNIVFFDAFSLLRLFPTPHHRKVNFLRELGAKLHPLDAIPVDSQQIRFQDMDIGALRSYVSWLFDILNIDVEGPELADLMVYYSGARTDLLLWLMRALLESIGGRRIAATSENLLKVWREPSFRQKATGRLLQLLDNDPLARAVLGASLFAGLEPGGRFDHEEVEMILGEFEEACSIKFEVKMALERLVELDLLAARSSSGEYLIPRSGTGYLLVESLSDLEQYVRDSLREVRRGAEIGSPYH